MLSCMVDGLRHDIEAGEGIYLGSVIDTLSSEVAKSGRFIAALKVNGEELDTVPEQCADLALTNITRLEVTTETTANLALAAMTEEGEYLAEMRSFMLQIVESYRYGDESRGGKLFAELATGMKWFVDVTKQTRRHSC